MTSRRLGNGVTETHGFNIRNQITNIAATGNTSLLNLTYGYGSNNNGRIRSRTDALNPVQ